MTYFPHQFEGPLERHGVGKTRKVWYTVLFLPPDMAKVMPFESQPQLRIEGEIGDIPVKNAFIPAGDGRYYVIVSPEIRKQAGLVLGQTASMRFRIGEPEAVDVPESLQVQFDTDVNAKVAWQNLTPGRRRGLAHYVASAKTETTSKRRMAAVIAAITGRRITTDIAADVERLARLLGSTRKTPRPSPYRGGK